jgi:hypothetical protein
VDDDIYTNHADLLSYPLLVRWSLFRSLSFVLLFFQLVRRSSPTLSSSSSFILLFTPFIRYYTKLLIAHFDLLRFDPLPSAAFFHFPAQTLSRRQGSLDDTLLRSSPTIPAHLSDIDLSISITEQSPAIQHA